METKSVQNIVGDDKPQHLEVEKENSIRLNDEEELAGQEKPKEDLLIQKALRLRYGNTLPDRFDKPLFSVACVAAYLGKVPSTVSYLIKKHFDQQEGIPKAIKPK